MDSEIAFDEIGSESSEGAFTAHYKSHFTFVSFFPILLCLLFEISEGYARSVSCQTWQDSTLLYHCYKILTFIFKCISKDIKCSSFKIF